MILTPGVVHNFQEAKGVRLSVPYAHKYPRLLFIRKEQGATQEFWSAVSTLDDGKLPQDHVEEKRCLTRST